MTDNKQSLNETIKEMARTQSYVLAAQIADFLRYKWKMNYLDSYNYINKISPISQSDWAELMYQADGNIS